MMTGKRPEQSAAWLTQGCRCVRLTCVEAASGPIFHHTDARVSNAHLVSIALLITPNDGMRSISIKSAIRPPLKLSGKAHTNTIEDIHPIQTSVASGRCPYTWFTAHYPLTLCRTFSGPSLLSLWPYHSITLPANSHGTQDLRSHDHFQTYACVWSFNVGG